MLQTLPPETMARLHAYADLLAAWTRRINLVSTADRAVIWTRHVEDSLRLVPLIPPGTTRAIDLGSGGGLPGLVLAIATGVAFDLVEADRRKCAFLQEAARLTEAPVKIHRGRIEQLPLVPAEVVSARALAPLTELLALAAPLVAPGGRLLLPKGARAEEEVATAQASWAFRLDRAGSEASPILVVHDIRQVAHA